MYDTSSVPRQFPDRSGFALPWALLMLSVLGVLAGVGFLLAWGETRATEAAVRGAQMFGAVDGALSESLALPGPMAPGPVTIATPAGAVRVDRERLLELGYGSSAWLLTATPPPGAFGPELTLLAGWTEAPIFPAPLTSFGDVAASSANGFIDGRDASTGCASRYPAPLAGIAASGAVPPPGPAVSGSPAVRPLRATDTVRRITYLHWTEIASGRPARDAIVPPDPWPAGGGWPVIELPAPAASVGPAQSGQGVLIAPGDLSIGSGFRWGGIILVGGTARLAGTIEVRGALAAGLSRPPGAAIDLGAANVSIQFDACAVEAAARRLMLRPWVLPGSWRERF